MAAKKNVRRTDGSSQRAESQRQGQMRRSVPVDRMASERRAAAAMAVKPMGPTAAFVVPGQKATGLSSGRPMVKPTSNVPVVRPGSFSLRGTQGKLTGADILPLATALLPVAKIAQTSAGVASGLAAAVGRHVIGRPGSRIGAAAAEDAFESMVSKINMPNVGSVLKGTTKNVYTSEGVFRGKDVFLESAAKTGPQVEAIVKGQVTRATNASRAIGGYAAQAAQQGIRRGLAIGGVAGATGAAVVNKLFGKDDKKKKGK